MEQQSTETEVWRPAPGFSAYEVSSLGRVRRSSPGVNTVVGKILRTSTSPRHRYLTVGLMRDGRPKTMLVHGLVASAFLGSRPEGFQVSHISGQPHDNRAVNLQYEAATTNNRRKNDHGTLVRGAAHARAKLTSDQVTAIRQHADAGEKHRVLAAMYGCSKSTITRVAAGHSWAHVARA